MRRQYKKGVKEVLRDLAVIWSGIAILGIPLYFVTISNFQLPTARYEQLKTISTSSQGKLQIVQVGLPDFLTYNSPALDKAFFYSGYPPLYQVYNNWYRTSSLNLEPLMLAVIGGLTLLGVVIILTRKIYYMLPFPILWLFFLFFFTGSNIPFPDLKIYLFEKILHEPFRSVFARFGEYVILASMPLLFLGTTHFLSIRFFRTKRTGRIIFSALLLLIVMISLFPVLNGSFLERQGASVPSQKVKIPNSYHFLDNLNKMNKDDYLYITIPTSSGLKVRWWNNGNDGYIGPDIFPFLLNGKEVAENKIRDNIIALLLTGGTLEVQHLLPIKYVIITFDQQNKLNKEISQRYYTAFKQNKNLSLIYDDKRNFAVFEIRDNLADTNAQNGKQIFILGDAKSETVAREIFVDSRKLLVLNNTNLESNYLRPNHIGSAFDYELLNRTIFFSEFKLNSFKKNSVFYPLFMELPNMNARLYVAVKPSRTQGFDIMTGFWTNTTKKWEYSLISTSVSRDFKILSDFARNIMLVDDGTKIKNITMPNEWKDIITAATQSTPNKNGNIGVFSNDDIRSIAQLNVIQVLSRANNSLNLSDKGQTANASILNVSKVKPSSYRIWLNATEPSVLVLTDGYDPSWVASTSGVTTSSIPIYGNLNGFVVNTTGVSSIVIEYGPQNWLNQGIIVMAVVIVFYIAYVSVKLIKSRSKEAKNHSI